MSSAIETHDLTRTFRGIRAVDAVNLRVQRGTFYGFLGPNGAGKSTTIKMLTGLLTPTSGEMRVLGLNPRFAREALEIKRRVGVVPENLALFDHLTAVEYLTFVGRMHLLPRDVIESRSRELLDLLRLEADPRKITLEFSHGMKKKLALAAALIHSPELLFLDEPFEGVDAVTSRVIRDVMSHYVTHHGTIFLTSHVLEIVERLCTHVGIISQGQLVEQTSLEDLRQGDSLENRFLEKVGGESQGQTQLSWLGARETSPSASESSNGPAV